MAYRNSGRKRRGKTSSGGVNKTLLGCVFIAAAFLMLGTFGYFSYQSSVEHDKIDEKFCFKEDIPSITVILIDHTDRINPKQRAALETQLWDIAGSIEKNAAIKVYSVDNIGNEVSTPKIDLCNPGSRKDVNDLTGNKRIADMKYEERFKKPLAGILDTLLMADKATSSPVMEAVQSVAITAFMGEKVSKSKKRLVLVSDLLEHTDKFSLYRGLQPFNEFKSSPYWRSIRADLDGVEVDVLLLRRDGAEALQTPALRTFWTSYFHEQGAIVNTFSQVSG